MTKTERQMHTTRSSVAEIFMTFLGLGLTSFGGPVAHLGYFRHAFVTRRQWLDDASYAELVALCQFLPGPASSQVGLAIGLIRGGLAGAFAAWLAFTLPSALLLMVVAAGASSLEGPLVTALVHTLKLVAVVIVAQALLGMARNLCPDARRATLATVAVILTVLINGTFGHLAAIAAGAIGGLLWCRSTDAQQDSPDLDIRISRHTSRAALALFAILLAGLPLLHQAWSANWLGLADAAYRSGALVFGGGHVVLPLLETATVTPGRVSEQDFLAGYGAAQAVPGPLFTFAAWLGMVAEGGGVAMALLMLVAIFLPGALLVIGLLPWWQQLRHLSHLLAAMRGANAAVVGLLAVAFYDPVWRSAVGSAEDFALVAAGFVLLVVWRQPAWLIVLAGIAIGLIRGLIHQY